MAQLARTPTADATLITPAHNRLRAALEIFRQLGAIKDIEQIEQALSGPKAGGA
jgi:hypothetical protein